MANWWIEFAAHRSEALTTNGQELQNRTFEIVGRWFKPTMPSVKLIFGGRNVVCLKRPQIIRLLRQSPR